MIIKIIIKTFKSANKIIFVLILKETFLGLDFSEPKTYA